MEWPKRVEGERSESGECSGQRKVIGVVTERGKCIGATVRER